jgi:hypothetical protein
MSLESKSHIRKRKMKRIPKTVSLSLRKVREGVAPGESTAKKPKRGALMPYLTELYLGATRLL